MSRCLKFEPLESRRLLATLSGSVTIDSDRDKVGDTPAGEGLTVELVGGASSVNASIQEFKNPDPSHYDRFGRGIAGVNGNILASADGGIAYLLDDQTGEVLQTFHDPQPSTSSYLFGWEVAGVDDDILILDRGTGVHLFDGTNGSWTREFQHPYGSTTSGFESIAVLGDDILVIGDPWDDTRATNAGAVHLFNISTGEHIQSLYGQAPLPMDGFGNSVATLGSAIIVGASGLGGINITSGSDRNAYLFDYSPSAGSAPVELRTVFSNPILGGESGGPFGWDVAGYFAGTEARVIISTPLSGGGATFVFDVNDGTQPLAELHSPSGSDSYFGYAVAVVGTDIVVSEPSDTGGMFIFDGSGTVDSNGEDYWLVNSFVGNSLLPDADFYAMKLAVLNGRILAADPYAYGYVGTTASAGAVIVIDAMDTVSTTTTDSSGEYTFSDVNAGTYQVQTVNDGYSTLVPTEDGTYRVTVQAEDGVSGLDFVIVENSVPVAVDDSYSFDEKDILSGNVLDNDPADLDGDSLTAELTDGPLHGELSLGEDGSFTYLPDAGFIGLDSFNYVAHDGFASSSPATVSIEVLPIYTRHTFTSSDVPVAIRDLKLATSTLTIPDSAQYNIYDLNVHIDITHPYDDDLEAKLVAPNGNTAFLFQRVGGAGDDFRGTVLDDEATIPISDGTAPFSGSYQPDEPLSAFDGMLAPGVWKLEIWDGRKFNRGTLNSWSIEIATNDTITNQPPVATNDSDSTAVNTDVVIDVLANDSDPDGDPLTVTSVTSGPENGFAVVNGDGTITYTPASDFEGSDSFGYSISDGNGGTADATVVVNVVASQPTTFSINDVAKREGRTDKTSTFTFTVTRSGDTSGVIIIDYATIDVTATSLGELADDYASTSGSLTFGTGETTKTISVAVFGDLTAEYDETFDVQLTDHQSGVNIVTGTGTIINDDKGTPVDESVSATDMALLAWLELDSSDDDEDTAPMILEAADSLALSM